uniref:Membrane protein, palmitoylated 3b (MAGUK p55 subfamily member 3) n=1 Tax=Esox lucius TaxID=8010 RepID=A0A6Q2YRV2_ESOLU
LPTVSTVRLHETLALLTSQLHPDANHKEDLVFLKDVFSEKSLGYLMKIHEKLRQYERQSPTPVLHSASCLAEDLAEEIQNGPMEGDERELLLLLSAPHLRAILEAHDTVAQKNFDPVLPPLPEDVDDELEEESVKIVRLVKNKEPLGATIRRDEGTGAVIVARIMRGGAADRSGLVHVGDELREVNGNLIVHKRPDEISQILSQSQGSITLKIIPASTEEDRLKESKVYLRALFDYTPFEDKATPCQEAGLPFKRGDILQVVSQDDATWWQAKRVGDCNLRAHCTQEHLFEYYVISIAVLPLSISISSLSFRLSRKDRQQSLGESRTPDLAPLDFLIYEEVTRYQPHAGERPRLVVLIGMGSVGGFSQSDYDLKIVIYWYTTRAKKSHEREGVEYHFVTKQAFEAGIQNNIFIEYGEYKENFYGTSLEAIRSVLDRSKMCLVDVQPEALKTLRTAEFKPYVIFVKPRIHESHCKRHGSSSSLSVGITEEDLQEMRQSAELMDERYGHLVDRVLVKEDLASACVELQDILERVETEVHWVPVSWIRTT